MHLVRSLLPTLLDSRYALGTDASLPIHLDETISKPGKPTPPPLVIQQCRPCLAGVCSYAREDPADQIEHIQARIYGLDDAVSS